MSIRTDIASEAEAISGGEISGVGVLRKRRKDIEITRVDVLSEIGERAIGKPKGSYITIDTANIASMTPLERENAANVVAEELKNLIGGAAKKVLIVGLGNRFITPDSIGPRTCDRVFVTRHIKQNVPDAIDERAADICAIAPGVLGVTGIESVEVIKGVANQVSPELIIAVDALASRNISRIGASIQLSDSGITPGEGIGNRREGLNEHNLNAKVIAIGIPTVVYASTIVSDIMDEVLGNTDDELKQRIIASAEGTKGAELVVSPKDMDNLSEYSSRLIADAINMAVNPHISPEEIDAYMN